VGIILPEAETILPSAGTNLPSAGTILPTGGIIHEEARYNLLKKIPDKDKPAGEIFNN